eukprot:PhM_4_TR8120/c0_g1_i1/m.18192
MSFETRILSLVAFAMISLGALIIVLFGGPSFAQQQDQPQQQHSAVTTTLLSYLQKANLSLKANASIPPITFTNTSASSPLLDAAAETDLLIRTAEKVAFSSKETTNKYSRIDRYDHPTVEAVLARMQYAYLQLMSHTNNTNTNTRMVPNVYVEKMFIRFGDDPIVVDMNSATTARLGLPWRRVATYIICLRGDHLGVAGTSLMPGEAVLVPHDDDGDDHPTSSSSSSRRFITAYPTSSLSVVAIHRIVQFVQQKKT